MAISKAYSENLKCIMVTFTFPHTKFNHLNDLLEKQKKAFFYLRSGNVWNKRKTKIGFKGLIRSLELTYGDNGWHPHTHEIWIVNKDCDVAALKEKILSRWAFICEKVGLLTENKKSDFLIRAVDVKDNASNSDYLAKQDSSKYYWGADREIAKGSAKHSKGLHPFEFLHHHSEKLSRKKCEKLFIEYSNSMKGKRQILWSPGLKEWAGITEKTDEEIAKEKDNISELICLLTLNEWKIVIKNIAQAEILYRAETGGMLKVMEWFNKVACYNH